MKKYSLRLYFFNLGRKFCWRLEARNFKIFPTIVGWFTKDRTSLNSFNILGMMEVQEGQELLRNYIFKNRREKIYFHVLFPWNNFQIFSFSSNRCFIFRTTDCSSMIYRLYHIYFWCMLWKLAVLKRIFWEKSLWCTSG